MLPGGGNDLTVDGGRAVRLAAAVALAVLGMITLPDLFRTPEPPPLPADVGFRPGETTALQASPPGDLDGVRPGDAAVARSSDQRTRRVGMNVGRTDRRDKANGRPGGRRSRGATAKAHRKRNREDEDGPARTTTPGTGGIAPNAPTPVSPVSAVPVAPPISTPSRPVTPADGSEEFAPGRVG